ncbi:MAG: type 1 glutamine amidotransferase domain-containing protein [Cytophagales bacterium]|nr:type 1 glutamine amidotransferase domain-containing protein [Cytophagales bacterium]
MKKLYIVLSNLVLMFALSFHANGSIELNAEDQRPTKVLLVLTSHGELGRTGLQTGFWLEEFAAPYYSLIDAGVEVILASPKGGQPPLDPKSEQEMFQTDFTRRFMKDQEAQARLAETLKLSTVNQKDFDAVFYSGGYGPIWDLAEDQYSIALIEDFYQNDKPIASVCHAPAIFKNTRDSNGDPLVKGKMMTAYSNSEEEAVQFTSLVPFSVQEMLIENGAFYSKGPNWYPYIQEDGLLISGQNPASAELVAGALLKRLGTKVDLDK